MEHAGLTVSFFTFSSPDTISSSMNYVATLREAAAEGRLSEIKSLVQNGADVLAKAKEYGVMPMHLSAINGHTDCVEYFLEQDVDVNAFDENGLTCAHHAAYENHLETLKMLTKYDANIETRCKENGNRPVEQAAYRGNFDCVEYLIQQGSYLNSLSPQGRSVLYNAADGGHLKIIAFLVERGADLNVRVGKHGYSLIHCTAFRAHEHCLEYFLDLGMDVNLPNEHGATPIMSAALGGHLNIIQFLVERGGDLNVQEKKNGDSLIHSAAFGGDVDCLRYFLFKDNDKDLPNKHGATPIMIAASGGHLNIIQFLDKQGADLNVQESKYGDHLIHSAAFGGDIDCLRYFLDKDINKDLPNKHGATPIMSAALGGHLNVIEFLVDLGADLNVQESKYGNHLIHSAAFGGDIDCLRYFLDKDINKDLPNKHGATPIMSAALGGHLNIIQFLVERGADLNVQENKYGDHLIHSAAFGGDIDCLRYFLDKDINKDLPNKHGTTPIISAALGGHLNIIEFLVDLGADLNVQESKYGNNLIHSAAIGGDIDCLRYFLDKDINKDLPNKHGATPIMSAALGGHLNIIQFLVERGADLNVQEKKNGDSLIHSAAIGGDVGCLRYFLDMDFDVDLWNKHGVTPIMIAASRGHLKTIEHLIRKDAKIDRIKEGNGETALHFASRHGHYDCVQCLVEHSSSVASTEIRNKFGKSPYDIAVENHHTAIADFLRI